MYPHIHTCTCVHAPMYNHICIPMLVCTAHACKHTCPSLHKAPTHPCARHAAHCTCTHRCVHTHSHTHTPHTDSASSRQHVTSCQAHVGLKFPEAGAPGRGYLISDLQFVEWADPGLCPDSSFLGPQWRVGAGECSCSDRAELL